MPTNLPYIPETITVHLGEPDQQAENETVPFIDYIKNVASSEIYPTWPESALRANILAQISFAFCVNSLIVYAFEGWKGIAIISSTVERSMVIIES